MYKRAIIPIVIFLMFFSAIILKSEPVQASCSNLYALDSLVIILDTLNYDDLPKEFRKTSDLMVLKNNYINLKGLDKLNISGSEQFSARNLPLLKSKIGTSFITTVIDLRAESHGFINGLPISFINSKNNANAGLTAKQVQEDENARLAKIKLNSPISFFNHPDITVVPVEVNNEDRLTASNSLLYLRIPVVDNKLPSDEAVDYFVDLVKRKPNNTWFHFHCKEGIGRTTTFMIMFDMMKNYSEVKADDLIKRQLLLANFNEKKINEFYKQGRTTFLNNFYKYCTENGGNFNVKWSVWKKNNRL